MKRIKNQSQPRWPNPKKWAEDIAGNIQKADSNWKKIK